MEASASRESADMCVLVSMKTHRLGDPALQPAGAGIHTLVSLGLSLMIRVNPEHRKRIHELITACRRSGRRIRVDGSCTSFWEHSTLHLRNPWIGSLRRRHHRDRHRRPWSAASLCAMALHLPESTRCTLCAAGVKEKRVFQAYYS
jgi:hypothetical protein